MEFVDDYDDTRPRLLFQSRPSPSSSSIISLQNSYKNKPLFITSLLFSLIFLISSFFTQSQFIQSLFLWFSLSLLVGPFAPLSITGGDIRVGQGNIVEFPSQNEAIDADDSKKKRYRGKRSDFNGVKSNGSLDFVENNSKRSDSDRVSSNGSSDFVKNIENFEGVELERDWSEEDLVVLRKQIAKHPVGKPRRWEVIAEVFKGRHSLESVISKAKALGKEKPVDSDSYSRFLKDRKLVDKRVEGGDVDGESSGEGSSWSSNEDIALLNALKAFPKDVAMRWEKIAAAVPGKSKAACVKRVSELKKEFRSSKASVES